jgi:hypothetical protein
MRDSQSDTPPETTESRDQCPDWAHRLILKIRDLEVELGNLLPDNLHDSKSQWWEQDLQRLSQRMEGSDQASLDALEQAVESAFIKLSRDLTRSGFTPQLIAQFVNSRLTASSRLKYCDAREVAEAAR